MLAVGFAALWGGYAVASWGYCMIKGYNVSFRSWVSPLHPYQGAWPPAKIPDGYIWPHSTSSTTTAAAALEAAAAGQAQQEQSDQQLQNEVMPL